jgi:hypothetical protein
MELARHGRPGLQYIVNNHILNLLPSSFYNLEFGGEDGV